jgi:hypothetical protein
MVAMKLTPHRRIRLAALALGAVACALGPWAEVAEARERGAARGPGGASRAGSSSERSATRGAAASGRAASSSTAARNATRRAGTAARPPRGSVTGTASGDALYGRGLGAYYGWWGWYGDPYWHGHSYYGLWGYYPFVYPYYPPIAYVGWPDDDAASVAVVETDVSPRRAEVWVDGIYRGQARDYSGTWDRLFLAPGTHVVEIRRDGYQTLRRHLRLPPSGYHRIEARLQKGEGIDPRSTEVAPEPSSDEARAEPLEPARVEPSITAFLRFEVTPADAVVYVDGEFLARADELARLHGAIPVAAGEHVIEVVRPGYRSERRVVDAVAGEPHGVRVDLERAPSD